METISRRLATDLQNATSNYATQNVNLQNAIDALKTITHKPLFTIPCTLQLGNKNDHLGITNEDRKLISDFISFLESKHMPMRELFNFIIDTPPND